MSEYYNPKRTKNIYNPKDSQPFKLSRSKIDLFIDCPRCFYLDRRLWIWRPPGFPFSLNSAVDHLLKKEFDIYRNNWAKHPLIEKYNIDAKPVSHELLEQWRHNFTWIQYLHSKTNLLIFWAIDDLWQSSNWEYIVVDYKATSKNEEITELNQDWQDWYKRQMEIYQWLLRKNWLEVSDTGYFVYCNWNTDKDAFDYRLEFDINLISYTWNDNWIENTIIELHKCLNSDIIPDSSKECDYCAYFENLREVIEI